MQPWPVGMRSYSNRFGLGVTIWVGRFSVDLTWDK